MTRAAGFAIRACALLLATATSQAASLSLTWTPPTHNVDGTPLTDLAHYEVHHGCTQPGQYDTIETVTTTSHTITGLPDGQTCYAAVTAANSLGEVSDYSAEVSQTFADFPGPVSNLVVTFSESSTTPELVGFAEIDAGGASGSVLLSVPANAQLAVFVYSYWDGSVSHPAPVFTLDSVEASVNHYVANEWEVIGRGVQSLPPRSGNFTWDWSEPLAEGGKVIVLFFSSGQVSAASASGSGTTSISVTPLPGLAVAVAQSGRNNLPDLPAPFIDNSTFNRQNYDVASVSGPVTVSGYYPSLVVVSVQ